MSFKLSVVILSTLSLLSLFPFDLRKGLRSISLYIPLVAIALFGLYEYNVQLELAKESIPIRIDLLMLRPMLVFLVAAGILRWILILLALREPTESRKPMRLWQVVGGSALALCCTIWFAVTWC